MNTGISLPALEAFVFDFDGTLAPNLNLPDLRQRVMHFTAQFEVPNEVYTDHYIVEIVDAASAWLAEQSQQPSSAQQYRSQAQQLIAQYEIDAAKGKQPFSGVPLKLQTIRAQGYRVGVVTRNCRAAVLEVYPELLEHVDVLHARDDTQHLKPDPRHLQLHMSALGCASDKTAMVGDGAIDMHAGRTLNMYCIGVLSGSADFAMLEQAGADLVLNSCLDIPCPPVLAS